MLRGLYFFWASLPIILWFFAARACYEQLLKKGKREEPNVYFPQAVFCTVVLALAIIVERTVYDELAGFISFGLVDINLFRWLLYPAMLVLLSYVQSLVLPEKKPRLHPRSPYSQR